MDVTVVIATYGPDSWITLANRARASVPAGVPVVMTHGATLHDARNAGLTQVTTEWTCHLDADDELEAGYFDAMTAATGDIRAPSVRYVRGYREREPWMPQVAGHDHACTAACLPAGNWLIVGSVIRTAIAQAAGWRDYPVYEDWDFFQRCWLAGATIEPVPEAIYRAHVRRDSRNRAPDIAFKNRVHADIIAANLGQVAA